MITGAPAALIGMGLFWLVMSIMCIAGCSFAKKWVGWAMLLYLILFILNFYLNKSLIY